MRRSVLLISALAVLAPAGCKQDPVAQGGECDEKSDCLEGLSCVDSTCQQLDGAASGAATTGYCATLAAMAGSWTFDTTVIGAEDLSPRGINGHFQMTVSVDNCEGKIELSKSGYDSVVFGKDKVQHAEAPLSESTVIPNAAAATLGLKDKDKNSHTMNFVVSDGQLLGYYSYADAEWRRAGFWGTLRGVKIGQELKEVEDFSAQTCEVRCLTQCDASRRRSDASLDEAALGACMDACEGEAPIVGCGAGEPLPEELLLTLHGPATSFEDLCAKATRELHAANAGEGEAAPPPSCKREPEIKGSPSKRELSKARLKGSFLSAEVIEIGYFDNAYYGELALVLQTKAGWYWTSAVDLSNSGVGGVSIDTTGIKLQARDMLSTQGREVIAELRTQTNDSDLGENEVSIDENKRLIVCATGSPPTCAALTIDWSSDRTLIDPKGDNPAKHPSLRSEKGEVYIAILPDDRVSISTPADAREVDRELAGIYVWPK